MGELSIASSCVSPRDARAGELEDCCKNLQKLRGRITAEKRKRLAALEKRGSPGSPHGSTASSDVLTTPVVSARQRQHRQPLQHQQQQRERSAVTQAIQFDTRVGTGSGSVSVVS